MTSADMEDAAKSTASLFDVFLRLRPSSATDRERFLTVESNDIAPTHITVKPPANDHRKRAIEKFGFTRVFEEHVGQRDLFDHIGVLPLIEGVLGERGRQGRDGLLATLGVTGSGKSHTILGSRSQRGLTQLALDVLFRHVTPCLVDIYGSATAFSSICSVDSSECQMMTGESLIEAAYADHAPSRGTTPAPETSFVATPAARKLGPRISNLPQDPPIDDVSIEVDATAEYAIVISMFEVYNDRIFDLLCLSNGSKTTQKRRALLFKSTESSPDRKMVAGLRKVVCSTLEEALIVLEVGLQERRVAGTGSNATSSRSHGFFNVDVKKRARGRVPGPWTSSTLTIVDLAGSERARLAKTAGSTLAEGGKINESLMYLGQCMQMQSDNSNGQVSNLVPFRQCKLTELLFHNSLTAQRLGKREPQKGVMIVTADPLGDFNGTSQILRYSALAREITVPRVPSTTSTILASGRPGSSGRSASGITQEELDSAHVEAQRAKEELEVTQMLLSEETERRSAAEDSWRAATDRIGELENQLEEIEAELREELYAEMEERLVQEQRRWRAARDEEWDRQDEHLDRKLDILGRNLSIYEDGSEDKENQNGAPKSKFGNANKSRVAELEDENAELRQRLTAIEREQRQREVMRTPTKKVRVLKSRRWEAEEDDD